MAIPLHSPKTGLHAARVNVAAELAEPGRWARYLNATLGLWLFLSAFAWPHAASTQMNTCLVGLFVGVSAVTATGWSSARWLTAVLAGWLALTTLLVYPALPATLWNNVIVALAVIALSFVPREARRRRALL